jgi:hypothetical protein
MDEKMAFAFYMRDLAKFAACFGLNSDDLSHYLFEDEEVYS